MAPNGTKFRWGKKTREAAELVAEDVLTDVQIARRLKIGKRTLERWKLHPEFRAKVVEAVKVIDAEILSRGIARRAKRVDALQDRWEKMQAVIRERAVDPAMDDVSGGKTGLLVRQEKSIGAGPSAKIVEEFAVDTGLLRELREHEKQAAQELGQWADKHVHSITDIDTAIARELARLAGWGKVENPPPPAPDQDAGRSETDVG